MRILGTIAVGSAILVGAAVAGPAEATSYTFSNLAPPSSDSNLAFGIDNNGGVVGILYGDRPPNYVGLHEFLYQNGNYAGLSTPPDFDYATGVNDSLYIVGNISNRVNNYEEGFIGKGGVYASLDAPSAIDTYAQGINDNGEVVGWFDDANQEVHGFTEQGGVYTVLNNPAATPGTTYANGIDNAGDVAGAFTDGTGTHGFIESSGAYTTVDAPFASTTDTELVGINDTGEVIGLFFDSGTEEGSFVRQNGVYTVFSDPAAAAGGTVVTGINDAGQIVGYFLASPGVFQGFIATPSTLSQPPSGVPEPATWAMMVVGVGSICAVLRRRLRLSLA